VTAIVRIMNSRTRKPAAGTARIRESTQASPAPTGPGVVQV
jgi:hypothetical protein